MKNLTIKKIALGVFLAGYAASSSFAAMSATTTKTIQGHVPTIVDTTASAASGYDYKIMRNVSGTEKDISSSADFPLASDRKVKTGDIVYINFKYADVDGDAPDLLNTAKTHRTAGWKNSAGTADVKFQLFIMDNSGATPSYVTGSAFQPAEITAPTAAGASAQYKFTIPSTAAGKSIDIALVAVSKYGDPDMGADYIGDIFNTGNSGNSGCTAAPCLITSDDIGVDIVATAVVTGSTVAVNDVVSAAAYTKFPMYGEAYKVVAYDKHQADTSAAGYNGYKVVTGDYTWDWTLSGTNSAATYTSVTGTAAQAAATTVLATGTTYTIGTTNSVYGATYVAGAQGFNLTVTAQ